MPFDICRMENENGAQRINEGMMNGANAEKCNWIQFVWLQIKQIFVWSEINNKRVGNTQRNTLRCTTMDKTYIHARTLFPTLETHWSTAARSEFAYDVILMNFRSLKYFRHYGRFIYSFRKNEISQIGVIRPNQSSDAVFHLELSSLSAPHRVVSASPPPPPSCVVVVWPMPLSLPPVPNEHIMTF